MITPITPARMPVYPRNINAELERSQDTKCGSASGREMAQTYTWSHSLFTIQTLQLWYWVWAYSRQILFAAPLLSKNPSNLGTQNQDEDGLYSKSGLEDRFWILVAACPRVAKTMLKLRKCFCLWMVMCKQSVPRTNYNLKKHLASQSRRPTIAASPGCEALQFVYIYIDMHIYINILCKYIYIMVGLLNHIIAA